MPNGAPHEPQPQPGDVVAWRHPRMACALGRFHAYGPGPFEVVFVFYQEGRSSPSFLLVRTPFGERKIEAAWLGPLPKGPS
jgi:hypothetical protein